MLLLLGWVLDRQRPPLGWLLNALLGLAGVIMLLDYGRSSYHKGSEVVYLDRRSRSALLQSGALSHAQCDRISNHYLVLGDGLVITVGHKYRHFKRE